MCGMRLSVIIPGYNTPKIWWRRCLKSVVNATEHFESEIICIDDGSEIEPMPSLDNLNISGHNIIVIRLEKNGGQSAARNEALKIATGEFITFVDSDDEVVSGCYDSCLMALDKCGADIAVYGVAGIWKNDGLRRICQLRDTYIGELEASDVKRIFEACLFEYPVNKLYRHSFIKSYSIKFDEKVCPGEDTVFNLQFVKHRAKWCTVSQIGYVYYRYDGSSLSRFFPNYRYSIQAKTNAWRDALAVVKNGAELKRFAQITECELDIAEWRNMWSRNSPFRLMDRWRFISSHTDVRKRSAVAEFMYMVVYSFLRKYCYIRPIRRWHIKRLSSEIKDYTS